MSQVKAENDSDQSPSKVLSLIRLAAETRIQTISAVDNVTVEEVAVKDVANLGECITTIGMVGKPLQIIFSACFDPKSLGSLVAKILHRKLEDVKENTTFDFVGEFCNLTAGFVKQNLSTFSVNVNIGLPAHTKNNNTDAVKNKISTQGDYSRVWKVDLDGFHFYCFATMEVFDWSQIDSVDVTPIQPAGEIELL